MAWFDEFFDEHYLNYWAQMLDEERTALEVGFIVDALALPPGAKILDLCCGQARHATALAKRGYAMTGLDLNGFLLTEARNASAKQGVAIRLVQGDMREIPFEDEFDAVVNLFTAFGYFEEDSENQRVLGSVARSLKPGGKFLLDHTHLLRAAADFQPHVWKQYPDGTMLIEERRFDARRVRVRTRAIFVKPDGTRAERSNDIRCYTCAELTGMLDQAGMKVQAVFGDFEGGELSLTSRRLILVARKAGPT